MDLELIKKLSKYPFIYKNLFYDSIELKQNKTCKNCKNQDCLVFYDREDNIKRFTCSQEYDNLLFIINDSKFLFNGLIFNGNTTIPKGRKDARINWLVNKEDISIFIEKLTDIESHISDRINSAKEKNFSMFHDFKTTMNIVFTCTQDVIYGLHGNSFSDKLEGAATTIKDLYSSLSLITSQLGMMDVIVNPSSITFGNKKDINLYKLFHKMSILFGHVSNKRKIKIKLTNSDSYIPDTLCYESIEFIPLILLDNAIKYSLDDHSIEIELKFTSNKIQVKISNWGPIVNSSDVFKIFDKFYRAQNAVDFSREGVGMGLWVAQKILETHNCRLKYSNSFLYKEGQQDMGLNTFEFHFPANPGN